MKRADEPGRDYRLVVLDGYEACASAFNAARSRESQDALDLLLDVLPRRSRVLDLGCGAGVPVARTLAQQHDVLGVDFSARQLALAARQAPGVSLARAEMGTVAFPPSSFDAIVSFYAIFHLPREGQPALFERMHRWLRPGGLLLVSLGRTEEAPYTEPFFGVEMFWSHFGTERYREMLGQAGFAVIEERMLAHGYGEDPGAPVEAHPLFFARRT